MPNKEQYSSDEELLRDWAVIFGVYTNHDSKSP
jgi:hypothetical protein